jgi:hypothetical protein
MVGSLIMTVGLLGQCYSQSYGGGGGYSSPQTASLTTGSCYSSNAYSGGYSAVPIIPVYESVPLQFAAPFGASCYSSTAYGFAPYGNYGARRGRFRARWRSW